MSCMCNTIEPGPIRVFAGPMRAIDALLDILEELDLTEEEKQRVERFHIMASVVEELIRERPSLVITETLEALMIDWMQRFVTQDCYLGYNSANELGVWVGDYD